MHAQPNHCSSAAAAHALPTTAAHMLVSTVVLDNLAVVPTWVPGAAPEALSAMPAAVSVPAFGDLLHVAACDELVGTAIASIARGAPSTRNLRF